MAGGMNGKKCNRILSEAQREPPLNVAGWNDGYSSEESREDDLPKNIFVNVERRDLMAHVTLSISC